MPLETWLSPYLIPGLEQDARHCGGEGWIRCEYTSGRNLQTGKEEFARSEMLVLRALGHGGMGATLLTVEPTSGHLCVCKISFPLDDYRDRLQEEIRILSAEARHPQIVEFRRKLTFLPAISGAQPETAYLMEYIAGGSLADLLRVEGAAAGTQRRLPLREALRLFTEIVEGLEQLHRHRIRHRDLKPANVLFDVTHGRSVKLCDLGIAKDRTNPNPLTSTPRFIGTYGYNAPETEVADATVDDRADYFSAGCILAEMLSGLRPFRNRPLATTNDAPNGIDEIRAAYGEDVTNLVTGLLAPDPRNRLVPKEIRSRLKPILDSKRKPSAFSSAHWPVLAAATRDSLRKFLFQDERSFRAGRLPLVGTLLALHAERTVLAEFGDGLSEVLPQVWLQLSKLRRVTADPTADVSQGLLEFKWDLEGLLSFIDQRIHRSLQSQLAFVAEDERIIRAFNTIRRRGETAYQSSLEPSHGNRGQILARLIEYKIATMRVWRAWVHLQKQVVDRIRQCSDHLVIALEAVQ